MCSQYLAVKYLPEGSTRNHNEVNILRPFSLQVFRVQLVLVQSKDLSASCFVAADVMSTARVSCRDFMPQERRVKMLYTWSCCPSFWFLFLG